MSSDQRVDPPPAMIGTGAEEAEEAQAGARMSFLEHLEELRKRIIYALYSLIGAAIIPGIYAHRLAEFMQRYFHQVLPHDVKMIYTQATEGFMFEVKLVMLVALLI